MKFSRVIRGYSPAEVDEERHKLMTKHSQEQREITVQLRDAVREQEQLLAQRDSLKTNLDSIENNSALMNHYERHFGQSVREKAKRDALGRISDIQAKEEAFSVQVEQRLAQLDVELNALKRRVNTLANEMARVIADSETGEPEFADSSASKLNEEIEHYHRLAVQVEAPGKTTDPVGETGILTMARDNQIPAPVAAVSARSRPVDDSTQGVGEQSRQQSRLPNGVSGISSKAAGAAYIANLTGGAVIPRVEPDVDEPDVDLAGNATSNTVLIAESDTETATLLVNIIEREGFETIVAGDGYAVSNMLTEMSPPVLVVLDTMLPYVDVTRLIGLIRDNAGWCSVPVLVLTVEHTKHTMVKALGAGANDSMEKPINPRELAARVKRLSSLRTIC